MKMKFDTLRLAQLTLPAKLLVTLFVLIIGPGYLVGTANIALQHQDADLEPGLTLDDLRRTFHGMEKEITAEADITVNSAMLEQVRTGGEMRQYLELGGAPAVQGLITWLEAGAKESNFDTPGLAGAESPSAKAIIAAHCIECHHADGGDMEEIPYAASDKAEPEYSLVMKVAKPEFERPESQPRKVVLAPTSVKKLVHITHAHVLAVPLFTMAVGCLFLLTGFGPNVKLLLAPLPMFAVILDIGSWWLARFAEPFIYVIAASGAIFGIAYALQILAILGSMWLGRGEAESA
jgi:cytochrome c553